MIVLGNSGDVFCRMPFCRNLSDTFLINSPGVWKKDHRVKSHVRFLISKVHTVNTVTIADVALDEVLYVVWSSVC